MPRVRKATVVLADLGCLVPLEPLGMIGACASEPRQLALGWSRSVQHDRPQATFDRDGILLALWADPIAQLAFGAAPARLNRGDEYVDLQRLAAGVQVAMRCMASTGGMLSRKTVAPLTWIKLLGYLESPL